MEQNYATVTLRIAADKAGGNLCVGDAFADFETALL